MIEDLGRATERLLWNSLSCVKRIRAVSKFSVVVTMAMFSQLPLSSTLVADPIQVETKYDARGQVLRKSLPYKPGETVRWTEFRHDGLDRQLRTTHSDGSSVAKTYLPGEGFGAIETVDESLNTQASHFDAFGNELYRDRFDGGVRLRTRYNYDVLNRLIDIRDPKGSTYWYAYDGHGNRTFDVDPNLGCREMDFDVAGRLQEQRAAAGALTSYTYDALGRVTSKNTDKDALQFSDCNFPIIPGSKSETGGTGDDTLDAGEGRLSDVSLSGGAGNDTYIIRTKSGHVEIPSSAEDANGGDDTIRFADLVLADLTITKAADPDGGEFLKFSWSKYGHNGSLRVALLGQFIERFEFADGSAVSAVVLRSDGRMTLVTTSGNDRVVGSKYDDFISGGNGDDIINAGPGNGSWQHPRGGAGNDTVVVSKDSGNSLIHEVAGEGTDTLLFDDLVLADLTISYFDYHLTHGDDDSRGNALELSWNKDGFTGMVHLSNQGADVERIEFSDGTAVSFISLRDDGRVTLGTTSGNDRIAGSRYDDFISAGQGNDVINAGPGNGSWQHSRGGVGDDVVVISVGAGNTLVHEVAGEGVDTLRFEDLLLSDLDVSYFDYRPTYGENDSRGNALELTWNKFGIVGMVHVSNEGADIEWFEFADGQRYNRLEVRDDGRMVFRGTPGDDVIVGSALDDFIYGDNGDDILDVGPGNGSWQHPRGEAGNDTVIVGKNSGNTLVHENADGGTDTIRFDDLVLSDLTITYYDYRPIYGENDSRGKALELSWNKDGKSGKVHVSKEAADIERFEFADGTAISKIVVRSDGRMALTGTSGNDRIAGSRYDDFISGGQGNDLLRVANGNGSWQHPRGETGDDVYVIAMNSGNSLVQEDAGAGVDTVRFEGLALEDLTLSYFDYGVNDARGKALEMVWNKDGHSGKVHISNLAAEIERFEFVDGSAVGKVVIRSDGRVALTGTSDDDEITGSQYDDFISAGEGNDVLRVVNGNGSWQHPRGEAGDDVYVIAKNSGNSLVHEVSGEGSDTVRFEGLVLADLTLSYFDYGDNDSRGKALEVSWSKDGHAGKVHISNLAAEIERFEFADGSAVSKIVVRSDGRMALTGTSGNDRILGSRYDDFVSGGQGNDVIHVAGGNGSWQHPRGEAGDDVYVFARDSGKSLVHEKTGEGSDTVRFDDLLLEDLTISYFDYGESDTRGNALELTWNKDGQSGKIHIANEGDAIEWYDFADGRRLSGLELRTDGRWVIMGTPQNDVLLGSVHDDFIFGGEGNDIIDAGPGDGGWQHPRGEAGNDTFIVGKDSGNTLVHELPGNGTDTIRFDDLVLSDLTIDHFDYRPAYGENDSRGNALELSWDKDGFAGKVHVSNEAADIERFEFADGSAVSSITLRTDGRVTLGASSVADTVIGSRYDDLISGGAGDDFIAIAAGNGGWQHPRGEAGNDTYVIGKDSGSSVVHEDAGRGTDKVLFNDLLLTDLDVDFFDYGSGSLHGNTLELSWNKNGHSGLVRIANEAVDVEVFEFADGETISNLELRDDGRMIFRGTPGDDVIVGSSRDDFIYANNGNDVLDVGPGNGSWQHPRGEAGNDTYIIGKDSGNSLIHENAGAGADTIRFDDLVLSDLTIAYHDYGATDSRGKALELSWNKDGHSGKIHISNEADDIERFQFADGSAVSVIAFRTDGRVTLSGTSGNDTVIGSKYDDIVNTGSGNDTLDIAAGNGGWQHPRAAAGNDIYIVGKNAGSSVVHEGAGDGTDTLRFKDMVLADLVFGHFDYGVGSTHGNTLQLSWNKDGYTGQVRISEEGSIIERFEFADGSLVQTITPREDGRLELRGTSGNDLIVGTDLDDFLIGGSGNDVLDVAAGNGTWQHPRGEAGNDTYRFGQNSGNSLVHEGAGAGTDTVVFKDLDLSDLSIGYFDYGSGSSLGRALQMTWLKNGHSGTVRVSNEGDEIEQFEFADGTVKTAVELRP